MPDAKVDVKLDAKELTDQLAQIQKGLEGHEEKVKKSVLDTLKSIFVPKVEADPEIARRDEAMAKRDEVIAKQAERIAALEDERQRDVYITKAQSLGLPGDDWASLLRKAETSMTAEERKRFEERLGGLTKVAKDSALFAELGANGSGEGDAWSKIEKLAEGIVAKSSGSLSKQQAISDVLKTPEGSTLYDQYLKEQTKGAA
jgi:hypothetical protein